MAITPEAVSKLGRPASYFAGSAEVELVIPENLVAFGLWSGWSPSRSNSVHHRFLLAINITGEGAAIIDGVSYRLPERSAVLVFPHQRHRFEYEPEGMAWLFVTFELGDEQVVRELRGNPLPLSDDAMTMLDLFVNTYKRTLEHKLGQPAKVVLLMSLVLHEMLLCNRAGSDAPTKFVDEVNKYIVANLHRQIGVAELAERFSYSQSRLRTLFRGTMGKSIGRYIKDMRMRRAQRFLGTTEMTIGEIAEACGYTSLYALSHAFKQHMGISPAEFRKRQRHPPQGAAGG